MNLTRKVYVASKLDQDTINQTFHFPPGFERTVDLEDAEFIVVDLTNKPGDYARFLGDKKALPVPTQNIPLFFVAMDEKLPPDFEVIRGRYDPIEPEVYYSAEKLFKALQWLQSIFPFYNARKTESEDFNRALKDALLTAVKSKPSGQ